MCQTCEVEKLRKALIVANKLLVGLLTDNQLDFRQPDGTTAREKLRYISDIITETKRSWES